MKIALIGATGFVGAAILQEALNRRHDVTAIVRNPEKLQAHPQLHAQKGDVYNEDDVARFVAGHEVVISAFNPGWSNPDLYNQQVKGTRAIINGEGRNQASPARGRRRQLGSQDGCPVCGSSGVPGRIQTGGAGDARGAHHAWPGNRP